MFDLAAEWHSRLDIETEPIVGQEFRELSQLWLEAFCPNLKRNTGKWVYKGIRWHAYSFNFEQSLSGLAAYQAYLQLPVQAFLVFDESRDAMFECAPAAWPDIRVFQADIYLFNRAMDWTFVTTHEMTTGLGPYFAQRPTAFSA